MPGSQAPAHKIAIVTDDGATISAHFGRARYYLVVTVEGGTVTERELRPKASHYDFVQTGQVADQAGEHEHAHEGAHDHAGGHGHGPGARSRHERMFANITDCSIVMARGMGQGAYQGLLEAGIPAIVTNVANVDEALDAYLAGDLENHLDRLH